jgi:ABC-type antimicrobial peptide transport system permease subunit
VEKVKKSTAARRMRFSRSTGGFGLIIGAGLGQVIAGFLFGTSGMDPVTFIGVPAILLSISGLAAFLPARKASRVNPVCALRAE